ncbi:putative membrane protein [Naematelia encephala]|uniref:Putative membrane protein n=1 Tax=Naematelia encephala TaxID=71784 RepID=A0A1Y2B0N2_9TREE|nr:putative membrane protein [Naematelia encephala]
MASFTPLVLIPLLPLVQAHAHHNVTEIDTSIPFDALIYVHMSLQTFVWAISFPIGMVLGLSKSKYHVPLQTINVILSFIGAYFGHHHHGRMFPATVHGTMAKIISIILIIQTVCGIFLKLHILEKTVRRFVVPIHSTLGKVFPILGWTQMLFGVATALGFCRDGNLGQCAAHYIMGSAFIGYAATMVIMLHLGGEWLARIGCSQEMLDSSVIMAWGIVNTFTEHHGGAWSHKDMQHTMMGVLWWAGGMLGIFLSRKGKRSFVPAAIIIMTGWGMSAHEQALMISSKIHALFGYALIAAGALRIVEICFVLNDGPTPPGVTRIFQHLPPYLLVLGGTLFLSATDEELHNADDLGIDHVSYALFDFSLSFLIYLVITFLVHLYRSTGKNAASATADRPEAVEAGYAKLQTRASHEPDGPEAYEMAEQDYSGEEDAVKIGTEDEVDWMHRGGTGENGHAGGGVRL